MSRKIFDVPLSEITFVAFDTETTGREPTRARLLELAAVRMRGLRVGGGVEGLAAAAGDVPEEDRFQQLVRPDTAIPISATRTHGIRDEDLRDCPRAGAVLDSFRAWLESSGEAVVLVAHNASFDIDILSYEAARAGVAPPGNLSLDTLTFTRRALPGLPGYSLEALCRGLSLPTGRFHRALDDARITLDLFQYCAAKSLPQLATSLASVVELVGEPQAFKPAGRPAIEQIPLMESIREAIINGQEVAFELRRGGGNTSSMTARPFAVYAAPLGASARAYVDLPANNEEGVAMTALEQVVSVKSITGGQGLLFG